MAFIVIYREHHKLNIDTEYYGPFHAYESAYEFLSCLPAIGPFIESPSGETTRGVKFIEELKQSVVR